MKCFTNTKHKRISVYTSELLAQINTDIKDCKWRWPIWTISNLH